MSNVLSLLQVGMKVYNYKKNNTNLQIQTISTLFFRTNNIFLISRYVYSVLFHQDIRQGNSQLYTPTKQEKKHSMNSVK